MPRPQRYDRVEIARVIKEEGVEEAEKRWPGRHMTHSVIRPMARALGVLPPYNRPDPVRWRTWQPEWAALLGTESDYALSAKLLISIATLREKRRLLGIPVAGGRSARRREEWVRQLALLTDEELQGTLRGLSIRTGIPEYRLSAERKRRGVQGRNKVAGTPRKVWIGALRKRREVVVRALRAAFPDITLEEMGEVMGITRERVRQIEVGMVSEVRHDGAGKGHSGGKDPEGQVSEPLDRGATESEL